MFTSCMSFTGDTSSKTVFYTKKEAQPQFCKLSVMRLIESHKKFEETKGRGKKEDYY